MLIRHYSPQWLEQSWPTLAAPLAPVDSLLNELGRLFSTGEKQAKQVDAYRFADAELRDEDEHLALTVKLPGVKESEIKLTVTGDRIQLYGERQVAVPEGFRARHRERQSYKFERTYRLPTSVDAERVDARLADGVLTVTMPKPESSKPRNIAVRSE
ncbi:MAG TPA: Hsp20/alpha crystallin family protein [Polyangiaceae bacterium]